MKLTRKQFLSAAAGGTVLVLLQACGGGGDDDGNRQRKGDPGKEDRDSQRDRSEPVRGPS